jgi:hypothetical protein
MSLDGRSFHSYLYDSSLETHVIISEFAPFGGASSIGRGNDGGGINNDKQNPMSALKVTTILPTTICDAINIDPVIGLICIDGSNADSSASTRRKHVVGEDGGGKSVSNLPWMCLYTRTSAFVLSIGYEEEYDDDVNTTTTSSSTERRCIRGTILHVHEPFEKQLLTSPRGSSILRIRGPPGATSASSSMFHRCGSMAMLLREGETDEMMDTTAGYVLALYHGLPGSSARGKDFDGRVNPSTEGSVTTPLRFGYEDLVRGIKDSIDAENAAYNSSSLRRERPSASSSYSSSSSLPPKRAVDFCFMNPPHSTSGVSAGFAATSILVLCNDGSVYGASPIIFDGTILPRTVVTNAISHLDAEISASSTVQQQLSSSSPAPTEEQECIEARTRQCRAARRYLLDAFGMPEGLVSQPESTLAQQGSYYVSASVVHSRSYHAEDDGRLSQALAWQPRLQGPLILPRELNDPSSEASPPCACIEPFGGGAGADVIDGFVVARDCNALNPTSSVVIDLEFGILPGEGSILLPRFEFESYQDCQLIDDLVRGAGVYVEHASIMNGEYRLEQGGESGGTPLSNALTVPESAIGRCCSIVIDPLDDMMIHVVTRSRIVTATTNAIAVAADSFLSRASESVASASRGEEGGSRGTVKTKVWSSLEVNSSRLALGGVQVSSDVHLGHISLARMSDGERNS